MADTAVPRPTDRAAAPHGSIGPLDRARALLAAGAPLLQAILTVAGAFATVGLVVAGPRDLPLPVFLAVLAVPVLFTIGAGLSTVRLLQRRSSGRVLAIVVDYLVVLGATIALLAVQGIFTGIDDLADTFAAGLPWLGLALLAFLLSYAIDAADGTSLGRPLRLVRLAMLVIAAVGWLVAVGAPQAIIDFILGLAQPQAAAASAVILVVGAVLLALWGPAGRERYGATLRDTETINGVLFASPNVLGFLAFFAGPLLFSLYVSFSDWDAFSEPVFIGLQNYLDILSFQILVLADPTVALPPGMTAGYTEILRIGSVVLAAEDALFWISLRNILYFALIAVPVAVVPALFLATLLNSRIRGVRFFRALYFIPSVAGVVGVAIIWKSLLDQSVGWVNYLISQVVTFLNGTFGLAIDDPQIGWLSDPATALPAVAIVFAWTLVGFNAVLFLAGLQGIPADLYEAASIDGANRWQRFRNVTVPMVAPTTFFVLATTMILSLQLFTEPYVLTSPNPGGPSNATLTPVMYLYNTGYQQFEFGYASAVAWVLFALIFAFTVVQYRRQRRDAAAFGG
jgi:ABC-type sugar transport system permease subunit